MTRRPHLAAAFAVLGILLAVLAPGAATPAVAADGEQPGRMILVLDSSGSMKEPAAGGQSKIEAARAALGSVVDQLPADADVGLRVFGATVFSRTDPGACEDSQLVVQPGTDNRDALQAAVAAYKPYGETPIGYALQQAAADIGSEGRRSIVLVSDGEATCEPDPCQVAGELAAQGIDLTVDVVGLSVSGKAREQLQCIAEEGRGTYYDVDSADEITRSLSRVAERAVRPFTVSGQPIVGGPADDPTPIELGDWTDTLGPKGSSVGELSYVYEKTAGTTLRVSVVTPGDVSDWDGVQVVITPLDDPEHTYACDTGIDYRDLERTAVVGAEALVGGEEGACDRAGRYLITVSRWLIAPKTVPIGIRVSEEPHVSDPGQPATETAATAAPFEVPGPVTPVVGGSSFGDATEVGTGRFSSTIVPGEVQMFRVPLSFGQGLRVRMALDAATPAVLAETGSFGPYVVTRLYNPMRGALDTAQDSKTIDLLPGRNAVQLIDALPPVSRDLAGSNGVDYSLAGDYYIGISVAPDDSTYEVPYELDLEVTGTAGETPTYADGSSWQVQQAVAAADDEPSDAASEEAGDGSGDESSGSSTVQTPKASGRSDDGGLSTPVKLAGAGGLGVVALGCLLAALVMLRPRRP